MKHHLWIPLTALGLWIALPLARADEPKAPNGFKPGDLLEAEFTFKRTVAETVAAEGEESTGSSNRKEIELVYIDRIDEVRGGRVVVLTRHFKKARMLEDGTEVEGLGLQGRNLTLKRGREGRIQAAWVGGGALLGNALYVAELGPWPDVGASWGVELGTREGKLVNVTTFEWDRPAETPAFVGEVVDDFGMATVAKGLWKIKVTGALKPAGQITGKVVLEGRETEKTEDGTYAVELSDTVELNLVRRVASVKELPKGAAPPAEEPREDAPEPAPEDEDEVDPMPEPEDEPVPEEEEPEPEDDPMPDDEEPVPDDDEDMGEED